MHALQKYALHILDLPLCFNVLQAGTSPAEHFQYDT